MYPRDVRQGFLWKVVFCFGEQLLECRLGAVKKVVELIRSVGLIGLRSKIRCHVDQQCTYVSVKFEISRDRSWNQPIDKERGLTLHV